MKEIWLKTNFDNYFASNKGRIKSIDRILPPDSKHPKGYFKQGRILSLGNNGRGYLNVMISINGKQKRVYVHRLVAQAFIQNPDNKTDINHKNGDKSDNHPDNLEWCTRSQNIQHAYDALKRKRGGKPCQCVETGIVYDSTYDAGRKLGTKGENIQAAIKRNGTSVGFHWKYV